MTSLGFRMYPQGGMREISTDLWSQDRAKEGRDWDARYCFACSSEINECQRV